MRMSMASIVIALLVAFVNVTGVSAADDDNKLNAYCKRPQPDPWIEQQRRERTEKEKQTGVPAIAVVDYRPQRCNLTLDEAQDKISVICESGYFTIYECSVRSENGKRSFACNDTVQKNLPAKILSNEEFKDTQLRCTKICGTCEPGWNVE